MDWQNSHLANPPVLSVDVYDGSQVRLPDGRIWFDYLIYRYYDPEPDRINWLMALFDGSFAQRRRNATVYCRF